MRFADGRRVPVDDPVLDPLFDAMARLHLPLAIHTGDPKAFFDPMGPDNERMDELASHPGWSFADRSLFPTWEELYAEFERRVSRSAKTTIIGVHFGNAPEDPDRVHKMLDDHPNFYVDTAARVPELGRKAAAVRRAILAHPDRVLFGTDVQLGPGTIVLGAGLGRGHTKEGVLHFFTSTWEFFETNHHAFAHPTPIQGNWKIDGIELPPEVLESVYHRNAERLLGLPPTPLVPLAVDGASRSLVLRQELGRALSHQRGRPRRREILQDRRYFLRATVRHPELRSSQTRGVAGGRVGRMPQVAEGPIGCREIIEAQRLCGPRPRGREGGVSDRPHARFDGHAGESAGDTVFFGKRGSRRRLLGSSFDEATPGWAA